MTDGTAIVDRVSEGVLSTRPSTEILLFTCAPLLVYRIPPKKDINPWMYLNRNNLSIKVDHSLQHLPVRLVEMVDLQPHLLYVQV